MRPEVKLGFLLVAIAGIGVAAWSALSGTEPATDVPPNQQDAGQERVSAGEASTPVVAPQASPAPPTRRASPAAEPAGDERSAAPSIRDRLRLIGPSGHADEGAATPAQPQRPAGAEQLSRVRDQFRRDLQSGAGDAGRSETPTPAPSSYSPTAAPVAVPELNATRSGVQTAAAQPAPASNEQEVSVVEAPAPQAAAVMTPRPTRPALPAVRPGREPEGTDSPAAPPTRGATVKTYTVKQGDMFMRIVRAEYGSDRYWRVVAQANPDIDPDVIRPGEKITLPPKSRLDEELGIARARAREPAAPATRAAAGVSGSAVSDLPIYKVERGDSLQVIARNYFGSAARWREIYELNRDKLRSADHIEIGQELRMPRRE